MIALDTNIFIYALEGRAGLSEQSLALLDCIDSNAVKVTASDMVKFEALSHPNISDNVAVKVEEGLNSFSVKYVSVDKKVLLLAAGLRRNNGLGALDSIHVASALSAGASIFITNDQKLLKKSVPDITLVPLRYWKKHPPFA